MHKRYNTVILRTGKETDHGNLRTSRSLGRHELGEEQPRKPEGPDRRGRLRPDAELQPGPPPRICTDRLEEGHQRSRDPRHRVEGRSRVAPRPPRDLERRPDRLVRRLQQLVRRVCVLGLQVLRRGPRRPTERRGGEGGGGGPARGRGGGGPPRRPPPKRKSGRENPPPPPAPSG